MTALHEPLGLPEQVLSIEDYVALGEIEHGRFELVDGRLVMGPRTTPDHMIVVGELYAQLRGLLPPYLAAVPGVDIDLELVPPGAPGWSRRPDLVVVSRAAIDRVEREDGLLRASEVVLLVEVVSADSEQTDHAAKRDEYAKAGIPRYWIIDLDQPVSLIDCQLAGDFGYQDPGACVGTFSTTVVFDEESSFPVSLDLDELLA